MDETILKEKIKNLISQNEKFKKINYEKNKGLGGSIVTDIGKLNEAFYKGRIEAYNKILKMLDEN